MAHVPVPVHPPPDQLENTEPAVGVAVSVRAVLAAKSCVQSVGQLMPAMFEVTVPAPAPAGVTVSVKFSGAEESSSSQPRPAALAASARQRNRRAFIIIISVVSGGKSVRFAIVGRTAWGSSEELGLTTGS